MEDFKSKTAHVTPVKPITFCQWEIAARMQGMTVLGGKENLGCSNARVTFGWKDIDETEIKSQSKYCGDLAQAERFLRSKPRMPLDSLRAVAVGPLGKANVPSHVIHFSLRQHAVLSSGRRLYGRDRPPSVAPYGDHEFFGMRRLGILLAGKNL